MSFLCNTLWIVQPMLFKLLMTRWRSSLIYTTISRFTIQSIRCLVDWKVGTERDIYLRIYKFRSYSLPCSVQQWFTTVYKQKIWFAVNFTLISSCTFELYHLLLYWSRSKWNVEQCHQTIDSQKWFSIKVCVN